MLGRSLRCSVQRRSPRAPADRGSGTSRRLCRDGKRRERLYHHCEPSSHGLADARRLHFRSVTAAFSRSFANLAGAHANFQTHACFDYRGDWQGGGDPQSCGNARERSSWERQLRDFGRIPQFRPWVPRPPPEKPTSLGGLCLEIGNATMPVNGHRKFGTIIPYQILACNNANE
jgi:hypothetical protein